MRSIFVCKVVEMAVLCENCYKMIRNNGKISTMFTHLQSLKMIALLGEKKENEKKRKP
jgi:hypothetical protein